MMSGVPRRIFFPLLLLCAAAAYLSYRPSSHVWALSNGADLGGAGRAIWVASGASLFLLVLLSRRALRLPRLTIPSSPAGRAAVGCVAGFLLFALFLLLRSRNHFLGDGWLLVTFLEREEDWVGWRPGMGTILFLRYLLRVLHAAGVSTGEEMVFALTSAAAGVFAFFFVLYGARAAGREIAGKKGRADLSLLLAGVPLTIGSMQLYFGYVENYSLANAFLVAFLVTGALRALGRRGIAAPLCFFALAVIAHAEALAFLPALLFLLLPRTGWSTHGPFAYLPEIVCLLMFLLPPTGGQTGLLHAFYPWTAAADNSFHGILSLEKGNIALLLAPVPLLLLAVARAGRSAIPPPLVPYLRFLRVAAFGGAAFALGFRPFLGVRDWDIFAFAAAPIALSAAAHTVLYAGRSGAARVGLLAAGSGLFLLAPWVLGNASFSFSTERMERLVLSDPHHFRGEKPPIVGFAWMMAERGSREKSLSLYREAVRRLPENGLAHANLGILYWQDGKYAEALPLLEAATRLAPDLDPPWFYLGAARFHLRRDDLGESAFRRFLERVPDNPSAASYLGRVLLYGKRYDEALEMLLVAHRSLPGNADLNLWIGTALVRSGRGSEAAPYLESALSINPRIPGAEELLREARRAGSSTAPPSGR
jgi:tetratricopeptide (TPR) repeat protein